ncbi:enoyl-CoA hydratase-related protein [Dactylosporangium sp. NPDC051541]|uniref:enoyl-CoA hydratase-related protein n=1 Tax=Dactylosporangium sp. NPDC051541 TaxID=3363977 RepID=UPI00378AFAA3
MSLVRSSTGRGVATLTLDSPPNRNALSTGLIEELLAALAAAEADDAVRVVVLTHTGPVFSSGADLKETAAAIGTGKPPISRLGEVLAAIWEGSKPVVARVAGPARAGGLGLIAAADIAVCSTDATFAFTEVRIGVVPAVISATVLARLSPRDASELYLTGATFDGARAQRVGLVNAAVPAEELDATVAGYVAALVRGAPEALAGTKDLLRQPRTDSFRHQIRALTELSVSYFGSAEGREGMLAFREKRNPNWVPDGAA